MRLSEKEFRALAADELETFPAEFGELLSNIVIVVEDAPPEEIQREFDEVLLGLYEGVPQSERSFEETLLPDVITLYQRNLERICETRAELRRQIRETILHEVGHHFGLSEEELEQVEEIWASE